MSAFVLVPIETLIDRNCDFSGVKCDGQRKKAVEGCYSSFHYYDTPQKKIASIAASLVKGHFFIDGNKRTSLFAYLILAALNNLGHIEDNGELVRVFVSLATSHKSVEEYAEMLFPE